MPQYELYIPLSYNDRRPIEPEKLYQTKEALIDKFGGITIFPASEGEWRYHGEVMRDVVVIIRVVTDSDEDTWFKDYKVVLLDRFQQEEVFIVRIEGHAL